MTKSAQPNGPDGPTSAPRPFIDVREPAVLPPSVLLSVYSADLYTILHVSPDFGRLQGIPGPIIGQSTADTFGTYYSESLMAELAGLIASAAPTTFAFTQTGLDDVERRFEARLVCPLGGGRPIVVLEWEEGTFERSGGVAPHPELRDVLLDLTARSRADVMIETYLHCVVESAELEAAAAVRDTPSGSLVLGAVGDGELVAGHVYDPAEVERTLPNVLVSTGAGDSLRGRAVAGEPAPTGWLAHDAISLARSMRDPSPLAGPSPAGEVEKWAPRTIVYLDDDAMSRELMIEFFRLLPQFELSAVESVGAARAAVVAHRPPVVVVDAWLGETSTEEFVAELLLGSDPEPPAVVILSADANAATVGRFRRLGVAEYLAKPIDLGELNEVLVALSDFGERHIERKGSRARTNAPSGN